MSKISTFTLGLSLASALFLSASAAQATVLSFDDVSDCSVPSEVTITGGVGNEACGISGGPNGTSSLVRSTVPDVLDSYWVAVFDFDVSNVSIDLGDFAADPDRLFLWAWDAANNFLGSVELDTLASDNTMHTLSLAFTNVRSISFGTIGALFPGDPNGLGLGGIYADNLTYTRTPSEVPVPAALPLLLTGLGGLGMMGLRRNRNAQKA